MLDRSAIPTWNRCAAIPRRQCRVEQAASRNVVEHGGSGAGPWSSSWPAQRQVDLVGQAAAGWCGPTSTSRRGVHPPPESGGKKPRLVLTDTLGWPGSAAPAGCKPGVAAGQLRQLGALFGRRSGDRRRRGASPSATRPGKGSPASRRAPGLPIGPGTTVRLTTSVRPRPGHAAGHQAVLGDSLGATYYPAAFADGDAPRRRDHPDRRPEERGPVGAS